MQVKDPGQFLGFWKELCLETVQEEQSYNNTYLLQMTTEFKEQEIHIKKLGS